MKKPSLKTFNYDKIREIIEECQEIPVLFISRLIEFILKHTKLNLDSEDGKYISICISFPIQHQILKKKKKLQKLEGGPMTSQKDLIKADIKVFNNRGEEHKTPKVKDSMTKYQLASDIQETPQKQTKDPNFPKAHKFIELPPLRKTASNVV